MTGSGGGEIFSFHLVRLKLAEVPRFVLSGLKSPGVRHSESFLTMQLGEPILSARRYDLRSVATFAWWEEEAALDEFLARSAGRTLANGWHVRLKQYRRWGRISEISDSKIHADAVGPDGPVVAVTLARLRLRQTLRFVQWGMPVERQVRDHPGKTLALAAMRPFTTFSTFSIWTSEAEMTGMVHGRREGRDGVNHQQAMRERTRKDFHREFSTMRFVPLRESGVWNGSSSYTGLNEERIDSAKSRRNLQLEAKAHTPPT